MELIKKIAAMLDGLKIYILIALAVFYYTVGMVFGAVDIGKLHIPAIDFNAWLDMMWYLLMGGGVRSTATKIIKALNGK